MTSVRRLPRSVGNVYLLAIAIAALCCIAGTFAVTNSELDAEIKAAVFFLIVAAFLIFYGGLCAMQLRLARAETAVERDAASLDALIRLEDAAGFARSVKVDDTFRLIANHLRAAVPACGVELYLVDETRRHLEFAAVDGRPADRDTSRTDACFVDRTVRIADGVAAIPLMSGGEPFGVLQLHFKPGWMPADPSVFDAIATRVAPLIMDSMAYERTVNSALTDATTDLPNERALYLILEGQIADSQRRLGQRPLTLLALDIQGFDDINQRYGHAAGDRMLAFVAAAIRDNLRQMDFLARCNDDEFFAVLPTAPTLVAHEIIARVTTALFGRRFSIGTDSVEAELNFGWAEFDVDGDTVEQLMAAARLRKAQGKSPRNGNVLWFTKEMTA